MPDNDFHLNNPPLLCVAARLQFSPIAKIKEYVDELQDDLRLKGFVNLEERRSNAFHIDHLAEANPKVSFSEELQWCIVNPKKKVSVRIDKQSMIILFAEYTNFSDAQPLYEEILVAVEKHIKGISCQELQLRYVNHMPVGEGEGADKWVKTSVLGMPHLEGLQRLASVSETSYQTATGSQLILRCTALPRGLTLPHDLLPLEVEPRLPIESATPFVLLENLHAKKCDEDVFSAVHILEEFRNMRDDVHLAFQQTVTPEALEQWK